VVADAADRDCTMTPASDEPTAQAQPIMERVLRLEMEYRSVLRSVEYPPKPENLAAPRESGFCTSR